MIGRLVAPGELTQRDLDTWRDIQMASPAFHSPFFSPEFSLAVGRSRSDCCIAVLERHGRTIGYFPFHRTPGGVGKPIGGPISDYQGPILAPDTQCEGNDLLAASRLKSYDFNHVPMALTTVSAGSLHDAYSPHIDLSSGYASYVSSRPKPGRSAIKDTERRRRKLEAECGAIRFVMDDRSPEAQSQLFDMKRASYRRLGVPCAFDVPWIARTLEHIRNATGPHFSSVLSTAYVGEKLISAHFGMRTATTLNWWFNSYDFNHRDRSPGLILLLLAAEMAPDHGLSLIDLGRGDEPYKRNFANGGTIVCEGSIERSRTIPGALRQLQKLAVRSLARIPMGRFESWPRRASARFLTGVRLPTQAK